MAGQLKNQREEEFCRLYPIVKWNGSEAARQAGYSARTANVTAAKLLAKPNIQERIQELIEEQNKRLEITSDRIKQELAYIAFMDIAKAFDENGNLLPIKDMPEEIRRAIGGLKISAFKIGKGEDSTIEELKDVKIIDKIKPLELLGKELGMFVEQIADVTSKIVTDEDLDARLESEKSRK